MAASTPDRPMDLTYEAGRASTRRADSALGHLPATAIADVAGRIRKSSSLRAIRRRLEVKHYRARAEMQSA
jgi:hypothetical protein